MIFVFLHAFSLSTDTISERFAIESEESSIDLKCFQWILKWGLGSDRHSILLTLQCVPNAELEDKLDHVRIMVGFSLKSEENEVAKALVHKVVTLKKQTNYQCVL